jgi:crossover junction endodeoxyribonuclease RuvC
MRVLGIDPGYERLGVAVLERNSNAITSTLLYSSCFKTSATLPFEDRLLLIGQEIERVIEVYNPGFLSIEKLFFSSNQKTATNVAEARGVIIYEAMRAHVEVYQFTPLQVKSAVSGYGRASKDQLTKMVKLLIKIDKRIEYDDEYDAIALALTYIATSNYTRSRRGSTPPNGNK